MSAKTPLSARARPNVEAAPWVIDELLHLEARADRLASALRVLLPLLARDEDRAVTGIFGGDTLDAINAARAAIEASANSRNGEESMACKSDDDLSDEALWAGITAGMITPAEKAQLRTEIDRLQSNLTASAAAFTQLETVAAEARRNDAIAMSWVSEAKHAIGYEGDMPGFIEALSALKARPTIAEQDQINAEAAIRSIYGTQSVPLPNDLLLIAGAARNALLRRNGGVVTDAQREAHGAIVVALTRLYLAEKGHKDPKDANIALLVTCMARSEQLARVLREVIEAIEFTPLGVRAIKALEDARAVLGCGMIDINTLRFEVQLNKLDNSQLVLVEDLLDRIETAEKERDALRAAVRHEADCVEAAKAEIVTLRAKIEYMEQQEPVGKFIQHPSHGMWEQDGYSDNPDAKPLYLAPGAQPAPSAPEGGKLVLIEPTPGMMRGAHRLVAAARRVLASADSQGLIRLDESGDVASELRSALEAAPEAKP